MANENKFWNWFKENNSKYLELDEIKDKAKYEILLDDFLKHLHTYCRGLFFLIGSDGKKGELIITAEGDTKYFADVEKLVNKAPLSLNWNVIAFKPPMESDFITNYESAEIDTSKSWFIPLENNMKPGLGVKIYTENYEPENKENFLEAAYVVLDTILGEKLNTLKIQYVDVAKLTPDIDQKVLIELPKLLEYVKWKNNKESINL